MEDPVSGFEYPDSWVKLCSSPTSLDLVRRGFAVLTADGTIRKRGYTTGTTVSAAVKAAILSLHVPDIHEVIITTPSQIKVSVPVITESGIGRCTKYSGDYPGDVTSGLEFIATASSSDINDEILFGKGIGRWDRNTPRFQNGSPAVSPQARKEIDQAIKEAKKDTQILHVKITVFSPKGEEVAKKTLNSMVGVAGGISVLGTTGFVEPWDDHLEQTACERASQAERVVLTTGRVGMRYSRLLFPDHEVVLAGSRLGGIIPHLTGDVIICGLPALVLKYINPHILENSGYYTVEEMMNSPSFQPAMNVSFTMYKREHPNVRIVLVNREGLIIGDSL